MVEDAAAEALIMDRHVEVGLDHVLAH